MDEVAEERVARLERDLQGGVLHLSLLVAIDREGPIHGYGLIKSLTGTAGVPIKEGTVYPILNELEREGTIRGRWGQGTSGPPRKYYELTPQGRQVLKRGVAAWDRLRGSVDALLKEGGTR